MKELHRLLITVITIGFVISLGAIIWIGTDGVIDPKVFRQEVLKASLQLVLIGLLGMSARELYTSYSARKLRDEQRAEEIRRKKVQEQKDRLAALNLLTHSYWGVKKSLHIIHAHKSALSYKEQMHLIIDYRLQLRKLANEIEAGMYTLGNKDGISEELERLGDLLGKMIDEWTEMHLELAWQQKSDEELPPKEKKVPKMIESLTTLGKVWEDIELIHDPFQKAANMIRSEL